MRIIARDVNMTPIAEIDMYTSFIWTDRYEKYGDFQLKVPCTDHNYEVFTQARYITIDKSDRVMLIEKRQINTKVDRADEYTISGRSAEVLLSRRVIMGSMTFGANPHDEETNEKSSQEYYKGRYLIWYGALFKTLKYVPAGTLWVQYVQSKGNLDKANIVQVTDEKETGATMESVENIIAAMLNSTIINPTDPARRFVKPYWRFVFSTDPKVTEIKMTAQFNNTNLYDAVSSLLVGAGLGCKVIYNEDKGCFDFSVFQGKDHSISQSDNPVVNFRSVLDNLVSTEFITDEMDYKTCAFVVGAMDNKKTRTISIANESGQVEQYEYDNPYYRTTWCQQVSLNGTGTSYFRRECIVDASDIDRYQTVSSGNGTSNSDVPITEYDYRNLLKTRGKTELMDKYSTYDMDAEVLPDIFYKYGKDYSIGDTISIESRFGQVINASVTEMIYSVDSSGEKAYPTIQTIGGVDGMDQLIAIFVRNPIYIDSNNCMIVPDIREQLTDLRNQTYVQYYVVKIIDYFLEGHLISASGPDNSKDIVIPDINDMDVVCLGTFISTYYDDPGRFPDVNTKALQFVQFFMNNPIKISLEKTTIPPLDELPSAVQ